MQLGLDIVAYLGVNKRCRSVAQPGSASGLGPEGREFESLHSDQNSFCRSTTLTLKAKYHKKADLTLGDFQEQKITTSGQGPSLKGVKSRYSARIFLIFCLQNDREKDMVLGKTFFSLLGLVTLALSLLH